MHQNNLSRDIFSFTIIMWLHFCISDGDRQVFHDDMIIVIQCFSSLFYHCKTKLLFSVDKNPLGPYNDHMYQCYCKYPLNLEKFHICVKLLLSCSLYLTTHQLAWTKLLCIKLSWFHISTFQLPVLVCHRT